MPNCAKGKTTYKITGRWKWVGKWQKIKPQTYSYPYNNCPPKCPKGHKAVKDGKCLSITFPKPPIKVNQKIFGITIQATVTITEQITICPYKCVKPAGGQYFYIRNKRGTRIRRKRVIRKKRS